MDRQAIPSLDPFIGALAPGRLHILAGASGTGKSAIGLRFIDVGLQRGETAGLVTSLRPRDLRALAEHLGIEFGMALAEDRLSILRYAGDLAARLGRAGALYGAIDELRVAVERMAPARLVIDSLAPFLADDGASGGAIGRLAAWLDALGATAILTLPGSLDRDYDRRLEPLVQEAAGIFRLTRDDAGAVALEAVTVRAKSFAPLPSRIVVAAGRAVGALPEGRAPATPREPGHGAPSGITPPGRRLTLLHGAAAADAELLELLRRAYEVDSVAIRRYPAARADGLAAVLVETTYQTMDASLRAIERLAANGGATPIIAISPFDLRSVDRAQVLHAGADEFLTRAMGPGELLQRLALAIRRRRVGGDPAVSLDTPLVRHPVTESALQPLDGSSFDQALAQYHAAAAGVPRTIVRLAPRNGDLRDVATLAMRTMRIAGGDLAAIVSEGVLVYLHGTRRRDAVFFTDRVRAQWAKQGQGALSIDAHVHDPSAPPGESTPARATAAVAEGR